MRRAQRCALQFASQATADTFFGRMKSDSTVWYPASLSFFTSVALMPRSVSFSTSSNGLCKWRRHVYGCQRRRAVKRISSRSTRASTA